MADVKEGHYSYEQVVGRNVVQARLWQVGARKE